MNQFSGIFPYLVSPVDSRGNVDEAALRRLVRFLIDSGVDGLSPLGSTGEVMYLTRSQREIIVKTTVDEAAGRVPVVAGVAAYASATAAVEAAAMQSWAAAGVVGIQLAYGPPAIPDVADYFTALAGGTDLPVVLYMNPRLGGDIRLAALERIVESPNVQYMKDASGVTGKLLTIQGFWATG